MDQESRIAKPRIILVSHGNLAKAMLDNVEMLMGPQDNIAAYGLTRDEKTDDFMDILRAEISRHGKENVIFISDLMNGTPCNVLIMLTRDYPGLYHITGMNLATIIGCITARSNHPGASAERICERTLAYIEDSILDVRILLDSIGV